jgi:hypothetical protein
MVKNMFVPIILSKANLYTDGYINREIYYLIW